MEELSEFEQHVGLPPKQACRLLGIAYVTYAHYKSGMRPFPPYHSRHIRTIMMLNRTQLRQLIAEVSDGD